MSKSCYDDLQTALLLCVADGHPGMFKTLAACKLEPLSNEFGEDSVQVWAAITVSAFLCSPCCSVASATVCAACETASLRSSLSKFPGHNHSCSCGC